MTVNKTIIFILAKFLSTDEYQGSSLIFVLRAMEQVLWFYENNQIANYNFNSCTIKSIICKKFLFELDKCIELINFRENTVKFQLVIQTTVNLYMIILIQLTSLYCPAPARCNIKILFMSRDITLEPNNRTEEGTDQSLIPTFTGE